MSERERECMRERVCVCKRERERERAREGEKVTSSTTVITSSYMSSNNSTVKSSNASEPSPLLLGILLLRQLRVHSIVPLPVLQLLLTIVAVNHATASTTIITTDVTAIISNLPVY